MPRLLQIVHGYPPREIAGTEIYAERITRALSGTDWEVHILSATRAPGKTQGSWLPTEPSGAGGQIHRIVNNLPWRPLSMAEHDPLIAKRCNEQINRINPDIVHIQHLLFLDVTLRFKMPTVFTLHDAWGWCPRGGTMLRGGDQPCDGPSNKDCPSCYADFSKGSKLEYRLGRIAGRIDRFISVEQLHKAWRYLPQRLRTLPEKAPEEAKGVDLDRRQKQVRQSIQSFDLRLSPSEYLAQQAQEHNVKPVEVLRHGVNPQTTSNDREHLLFLGSLAKHKGPHIVAEAWSQARKTDPEVPDLLITGPVVDQDCIDTLPAECIRPPASTEEVMGLLGHSHALILGSIWPENAPLVISEARACKTPVIAPRIGGIPELIEEGVDGWLYPPGDTNALAQLVAKWRELQHLHVRHPLSFDAHMDMLLSHYLRLLDERNPA